MTGDDLPKLVRDRIPAIIEEDGGVPVTEQVTGDELAEYTADKLVEEAKEFREDRDPAELADVLEVLEQCLALADLSWHDLQELRLAKRADRGGFDDSLVLKAVED
ncbi:MAG: nucleoside triphosphate pyrophosphohydrolase [Candidatus Nanohaloarchaea archaeon]|nr:nucleoside triphosphate pyrophosphohydrolase [Candidatus Nanohaloarchaea archaeon]